jgi:glycosyltransferase involved in cell wall biosynthesis
VVRFCGVQPDPRPFLRASDVFVLPSLREGMPNALLEAMACGLPCIAPPSAGGDEVIEPETGLVPPSNDPADLLAALRALAGYPGRRAAMGRAAAERAKEFDIERVVDRFEDLYRSVVTEAAGR